MVGLSRQGMVKQPIVAELGTSDGASFAGRGRTAKYRMGPMVKVHCERL